MAQTLNIQSISGQMAQTYCVSATHIIFYYKI